MNDNININVKYFSNLDCPVCRAFVVLRGMNPLYLPPGDVQQPIHEHSYQNLTINRNGRQILNSDNVRIVVYPTQPVHNQMVASIEVREINVVRNQNQNQPLRLNRRRLSVQPQRLNYNRIRCIFCNKLVTTFHHLICDACLMNVGQ